MQKPQASSTESSASTMATSFIVGQDDAGHWLALESCGLSGGIFKTLADAIRFADAEADHRSGAIALSSALLKLTF